MTADQHDEPKPPVLVVADNVTVLPAAPKRPDHTRRPPGAFVWLVLLATPALLEVVALVTRRFPWTLSHSVWWAQGPPESTRWWLVALPVFGLVQWASFHFLLGPRVDGWFLVGALVVMLAFGVAGVALNR